MCWNNTNVPAVSPFFNSLSNRLRITNYCLRSVSSLNLQDLLKETTLPEQILIWSGIYNTCIWIRSPIPIKYYLLIVIEFFSELKVSCGLSNNIHCKLLMAKVLQWKQVSMLIRRLWWGWSHNCCWSFVLKCWTTFS